MKELTHLLIDTETLGKKSNSVCMSLACVPFIFTDEINIELLTKNSFYVKFDIRSQIQSGRVVEKATVDWWKKQGKEFNEIVKPTDDDMLLTPGLLHFIDFVQQSQYNFNKSFVFCRGQDFDFPLLENMFEMCELKYPFNTWKHRDTRTFIDCLTGSSNGLYEPKTPLNFNKHNSLGDAIKDIVSLMEIHQIVYDF